MNRYLLAKLAQRHSQGAEQSLIQKGFTLIELVVIGAILVILAGLAIPAYQNYIASSRTAKDTYQSSAKAACQNLTGALSGVAGFSNAITTCN
jgi:Tfp pilus assembly major pilin PilA